MGQKVSPHGLRVGIIKDWDSKWYAEKKDFADYLIEDNKIREFVKKKLYTSGISKILVERAANNKVKITIFTAKPGMVIGRGGSGIDELRLDIEKLTRKSAALNIIEIKKPELDSQLVAESVALALEKRVSFRRAMKQAIGRTMKAGSRGIKVVVSGRLGGAEMARSEKYSEGNVPLHTLRADISYGFAEADTTYGKIGVKVWVNHGEILPTKNGLAQEEQTAQAGGDDRRDNRPRRRPSDNNDRNASRPRTPRPEKNTDADVKVEQ